MFARGMLRWMAVAALAVAAVVNAQQLAPPQNRVVMQVSDSDPAKWNLALNNARNLQADLGAKNVEIEIVAYGPGIGMLKAESIVGNRIGDALGAGVKIVACGKHDADAEARQARTCWTASAMSAPASSRSCSASNRAGHISGRRRAKICGRAAACVNLPFGRARRARAASPREAVTAAWVPQSRATARVAGHARVLGKIQ